MSVRPIKKQPSETKREDWMMIDGHSLVARSLFAHCAVLDLRPIGVDVKVDPYATYPTD